MPHAVLVTANRRPDFEWRWCRGWRTGASLRSGTYAGESRVVAGFGGSRRVNFEYVANGAMVFAPEPASREELIEAIGRGVGRVAIHEFLHQLLPKQHIHDSKDARSYEGNSPALVEGYFGDLHWDIAGPWLKCPRWSGSRRCYSAATHQPGDPCTRMTTWPQWWPLFSPPVHYVEEAEICCAASRRCRRRARRPCSNSAPAAAASRFT